MTLISGRAIRGFLEDAGLLLLAALLLPVGILLLGTPIVAVVRVVVAIAHRL